MVEGELSTSRRAQRGWLPQSVGRRSLGIVPRKAGDGHLSRAQTSRALPENDNGTHELNLSGAAGPAT
jgi:hypothetical protein